MIPITRKELYLNKIVGNNDYSIPEKPISEEEFFFAEILGEAVQAPEPLTRYQMYLAKIAGRNIEIPYPEVRLEYFLARAAGMDVETPVPITREEIYWSNYTSIVEFEVENVPPLTYKAIEGTLKNYRIYGNTGGVGDKTANQWGSSLIGDTHVSPTTGLPEFYWGRCGIVTPISITGESSLFITFDSEKTGVRCMYSVLSEGVLVRRQTAISSGDTINVSDGEELYVAFYRSANDLEPDDITNIMLNSGSTAVPYEPYGYKVPVTVTNGTDTETTNIYLPEPIKIVGDEAEYVDYNEQKQHRVRKNLLQNIAASKTISGVTFTVNADGSVVCDGQASSKNADLINPDFLLPSGTYILTGCPDGGSDRETYKMLLYVNGAWRTNDMGSGANFTLTETSTMSVRIVVYASYTCNNLTFYPMIRKADIEDDTYEPYIENTELDVTLPALPTLSGTNTLSVGTEVQPSKVYIKGEKERE